MRHSLVFRSIACLIAFTAVACEQSTDTLLLPFGGRAAINGQNGQPLRILPDVTEIPVGQFAELQTNAPLNLRNQVQWRSSNSNVAAVSSSGRVTGIFPGVATITARFAFDTTQAATATVTVLGVAGP